ncbi:MAG: glycosyltransferase family 4 protein [bacterium]|nr:glycosyltransferase family 4 protein [bacterium]
MKKPIRMLFLTACTGRGGAGNSLFYLLKYIDRSRIEPLVVMPSEGVIGEKLQEHKIPYLVAPRLKERFFEMRFRKNNAVTRFLSVVLNAVDSGVFVFELARIIRQERIELVHCNHLMVKFIGAVAAWLCGVPAVLHCRTIYGSRLGKWMLNRVASLDNVRGIIAVSRASAANFPDVPQKVSVVHNAADLAHFDPERVSGCLRSEFGLDQETVVIGFMGRIVKWKGVDNLLAAAEQVLAQQKEAVLVVVGDNPFGSSEDLLAHYRRETGASERVLFTGFRQDVRPCLKDIDIMVVPSITPDPCPRTVIEALAFGIPVVGSAMGGILELVRDGETGFLVDPRDVPALSERITRLVENRGLRCQMGKAARQDAVAYHNAEDVAQRIQNILLDAIRFDWNQRRVSGGT